VAENRTQIWSSGGGVQSTAIAALIVQGRLPKPDLAVIADTGRELHTTWDYLNSITIPALQKIGVQLQRVDKSLYATVDLWGGADKNSLLIPAFTNANGEIGKLPGYCSNEWKARVIHRWATKQEFVKNATMWIGISTDESSRAVPVEKGKWHKKYPLIEMNISRADCQIIVEKMGWPTPPRSSCWMCPNHHESEWIWQAKNAPKDHAKAIQFDALIRRRDKNAFLHPSGLPLSEVQFDSNNEVMFGKACQTGLCFT
jgi:hypothetical protein